MRYPDTEEIVGLTEKLKSQGDITEQEADGIYSLFSRNCARTKFNPKSAKFDAGLLDALKKFTNAALDLVRQEKFGIFISSFPALPSDFSYYGNYDIYATLREIKKNLPPKDRIAIFNVSFDRSENGENQAGIINGTDVFKNAKRETWVFLEHNRYRSYFSGYRPDRFGFFRRRDMNGIFENYTDIPVVSDPFVYFTAEFFFNYAKYNIINTSDILSCAVIWLVNSRNIPFLLYGDMDLDEYGYENRIAVEAETSRRITQAVRRNGKYIIEEMKEKGIIRPLKDDSDIYSRFSEIDESTGAEGLVRYVVDVRDWYEFDDYYRAIDFACSLLNETLKYGRTTEQSKNEALEEDIWITER
jgi:hypothetical protein